MSYKSLVLLSIGIILTLSSFIIPFHWFLPAWTHWDGEFLVRAGQTGGPTIGFNWGTFVRGMLIINGDEDDILFSVLEQTGEEIIPERVLHNKYIFEFESWKSTSYDFVFDNTSPNADRTVYWIIWGYWYNLILFIVGGALSVAGLIFVGKSLRKRPSHQETNVEIPKPRAFASVVRTSEYFEGSLQESVKLRCGDCGTLNDEKARFCNHCGVLLSQQPDTVS